LILLLAASLVDPLLSTDSTINTHEATALPADEVGDRVLRSPHPLIAWVHRPIGTRASLPLTLLVMYSQAEPYPLSSICQATEYTVELSSVSGRINSSNAATTPMRPTRVSASPVFRSVTYPKAMTNDKSIISCLLKSSSGYFRYNGVLELKSTLYLVGRATNSGILSACLLPSDNKRLCPIYARLDLKADNLRSLSSEPCAGNNGSVCLTATYSMGGALGTPQVRLHATASKKGASYRIRSVSTSLNVESVNWD
jgi:hypothetical protein